MKRHKKIIFIFTTILIPNCIILGQTVAVKEKQAVSKFSHTTEMGFLLGSQGAINNQNNYPYNATDSNVASYYSIYPSYPSQGTNYSNFSVLHFSGYKVHKAVSVGVFVGLDNYRANVMTPFGLGFRSTLMPSRNISPILNMDAGYGKIWKRKDSSQENMELNGGLMLNPSVGYRIKIGADGSNLSVNIGYKLQKSTFTNNIPDQKYYLTENRSYNRLSLRMGIGF